VVKIRLIPVSEVLRYNARSADETPGWQRTRLPAAIDDVILDELLNP